MKIILLFWFLTVSVFGQLIPEFSNPQWQSIYHYWNIIYFPSPGDYHATNQTAESTQMDYPDPIGSTLFINLPNTYGSYKLEFWHKAHLFTNDTYTFSINNVVITNLPASNQWKTNVIYFSSTNDLLHLQWQVIRNTAWNPDDGSVWGELDEVVLIPLTAFTIQKIANGIQIIYPASKQLYGSSMVEGPYHPCNYAFTTDGTNNFVNLTNLLQKEFFSIR